MPLLRGNLACSYIFEDVPMNIAYRRMPSGHSWWKGDYLCSVSVPAF